MLIAKRLFDMIAAALIIFLTLPLSLALSIFIKLTSPGPVFFKQERVGKDGTLFDIFKFRTMRHGSELEGTGYFTSETDPRITAVGKFLRRWSLDELPQLINVVRGEMSIVGPRPTLKYQVDEYTERQRQRLKVKPGLTGLAQIKGRNSLTWPERIEIDIEYIENWNFLLDIKIMFKTFSTLISKKGIYD